MYDDLHFLKYSQAAEILQISARSIMRAANQGLIQRTYVMGSPRILRSSLFKLDVQTQAPAPVPARKTKAKRQPNIKSAASELDALLKG